MIFLFYHKEDSLHILFQITQNFVHSPLYGFLLVTLKCHERRTEAVDTVNISSVIVEREKTGTGCIDVTAPADEERNSRIREVRAVAVP